MTPAETSSDRIRRFLQRLSPASKRNLLAEIERLQLYAEDELPGADMLLGYLRAEFPDFGDSFEQPGSPMRSFFEPLERLLVNRTPEHANCGQISRGSLAPIWEWMSKKLLPTMARDYVEQMKREVAADNQKQAAKVAAAFQFKVLKYIEGTLSSSEGAAQVRAGLAVYTSSHAVFDDLAKMLVVLRAREPLHQFLKALPQSIGKFEGKELAEVRSKLDGLVATNPETLPFALTMIAGRLKAPWQLLRLATKAAASKNAADVAATPYALAVSMVLDQIDAGRSKLRQLLRARRILPATEILASIYDSEYALRVRLDRLEDGEWGRRLDRLMQEVAAIVQAEVDSVPDETDHVLASRRLRRHETMSGRLTYYAWKSRDAFTAVAGRTRSGGAGLMKAFSGG
jgi:hypothetical protein